jgi:hypothetical protein
MATIPFEKPLIFNAVRTSGFVYIPDSVRHHTVDETVLKLCCSGTDASAAATSASTAGDVDVDDIPGPASLQRRQTMSGNIMVIEPTIVHVDNEVEVGGDDDNNITSSRDLPSAYWLQRRLGYKATTHGSVVRLAYKLRFNNNKSSKKGNGGEDAVGNDGGSSGSSSSSSPYSSWELDTDIDGKPIMVMIHILHSQILDGRSELGNSNPINELSALQLIYEHNPTETAHVTRTRLISMCHSSIYCVLPYYHDGTLLQFCQSITDKVTGDARTTTSADCPLEEPLARFLFRQIMQVRQKTHDWTVIKECKMKKQ